MTLSRLIRRPELASALGALVIFIFFMIVAPAFRSLDAFATTLYASSTLGVALAVGLLICFRKRFSACFCSICE